MDIPFVTGVLKEGVVGLDCRMCVLEGDPTLIFVDGVGPVLDIVAVASHAEPTDGREPNAHRRRHCV